MILAFITPFARTSDAEAEAEAEAEAPEAVDLWWKRKQKRLQICRFRLFLQFLLDIHLNSSKFFLFTENNVVKYYLTNLKTNLPIEKQNLKQIWKRKRFRKRSLSAGNGSAGSGSRSS
jgi:hypothetical protein